MKSLFFCIACILILDGCIDPLPVTIGGTTHKMVVDGMITQEPGPYQVKLFYSNDMDGDQKKIIYETDASVWIQETGGPSVQLTQKLPGIYETNANDLRGETGKSYSLRIVTKDGREYQSAPQLLQGGGTVSRVYTEFERDAINGDDSGLPQDVFNVYIDSQGDTGTKNLMRWRWNGTYTARSYPELYDTLYPRATAPTPKPLPCSGYIYTGTSIVKVSECTCCTCWATEYSPSALVSNNDYNSNYTFNKVSIGKVPASAMRFHERYYAQVEQLRLSDEAYKFWKLIQAQQEATGSIFQPNAVRIQGNVHSVQDTKDVLLGFFTVAGISRNGVFINRSDVPYEVPAIGMIGDDCRRVFENATTTQPAFW